MIGHGATLPRGCDNVPGARGSPCGLSHRAGRLAPVTYKAPEYHPAFEEYCETIFELKEDAVDVIQARIAERLEVSRPAVSEMIRRMEHEGLVEVEKGGIRLTPDGVDLAEQVVRRHRLAERFLTDILGLSWAEAHAEAGRWEHVISDRVESAMVRVLKDPTTCPHGNPIPGSKYAAPDAVTLDQLPVGATFTVTRIPEELEFAPGMLEFLETSSLQPGRDGTITASSPDGTTTVEVGGKHVGIGAFASTRILVTAR
jgi:DtxR family transcriptional regulator, Mn-dependent transcriptional regulator